MSLVLSGDNGVSDIDGSASTPAIRGTDANTGIFFPAADTIAFSEGGVEAMRIDSSGNVGIGTSSPGTRRLFVQGANTSAPVAEFKNDSATNSSIVYITNGQAASAGVTTVKSQLSFSLCNQSGPTILAGQDSDFTTDANQDAYLAFFTTLNATSTERMRIDSSGNVGIGTSSPSSFDAQADNLVVGTGSGHNGITVYAGTAFWSSLYFADGTSGTEKYRGIVSYDHSADAMLFYTASAERARITSGGDFCVGKTASNTNVQGIVLANGGFGEFVRTGNPALIVGRLTNDGDLVQFLQDNTTEGSISVSGNTVSYNGFSGGHWTQLPEGRGYNPEILRGTVMSTIGDMCEWKSVVWDEVIEHPAVPAVEAKEAVVDEEGNVIEPAVEAVEGKDAWTETINKREAYLGNLAVGATFEEDGVTKTVVDDGNERLPKVKISDVVGDKAVYGVFQTYDEVQDMLVTSLGAFVVRIAAGVTVQIGDLLESNGDGCAKVQDDDVIRSKTIGKVTSTVKTATYADGSYTVPCVLYCG